MSPSRTRTLVALAIVAIASASCKESTPPIVATKLTITTAPSTPMQNRVVFAEQPTVQLRDAQERAALQSGVVVTATLQTGGGTIGGTTTATTDAAGLATFTDLSIAGNAGTYSIEFSAPSLESVSALVTTTPGAASIIAVNAGDGQTATVNSNVPVAPSVKVTDVDGNGVSGFSVSFSGGTGGGAVIGVSQVTNANGIATVTSWTLGTIAGTNSMQANGTGLTGSPVTFTATGAPGAASKLVVVTAPSSTAQNRSAFATQPTVRLRDAFDNNVAQGGVSVSITITGGGGSLQGTNTASTDASGIATFSGLAISGTAGAKTLTFTSGSLSHAVVGVTTTPGPAASIAIHQGNNQSAQPGNAVPLLPAAKVNDQDGNGVSGVSVTWAVTSGGGSATGTSSTTNSSGVAFVGSWTVGPTEGTNTLTAASAGLSGSPMTFTATASSSTPSSYNIELVFLTSVTASQQAAFNSAVTKWQRMITGELGDVLANTAANSCTPAINNEVIDDLRIYVTVEAIDGPGNVLGSAGPCFIRNGSLLPVVGAMRFDSDDLAMLESNGALTDVILHEMGHVIGIGTIWSNLGVLTGAGTSDPYFTGTQAITQFNAVGGTGYLGNKVPVENTGGAGTADGHWRESELNTELMTGFLDLPSNPLSKVTVGSLQDIGYVVNISQADSYTFIPLIIGPRPPRIHLVNDLLQFVPVVLPSAPLTPRPPRRPQ